MRAETPTLKLILCDKVGSPRPLVNHSFCGVKQVTYGPPASIFSMLKLCQNIRPVNFLELPCDI